MAPSRLCNLLNGVLHTILPALFGIAVLTMTTPTKATTPVDYGFAQIDMIAVASVVVFPFEMRSRHSYVDADAIREQARAILAMRLADKKITASTSFATDDEGKPTTLKARIFVLIREDLRAPDDPFAGLKIPGIAILALELHRSKWPGGFAPSFYFAQPEALMLTSDAETLKQRIHFSLSRMLQPLITAVRERN